MSEDARVVRLPLKYGGAEDLQVSPRHARQSRWVWIAGGVFVAANVVVLGSIIIVGKSVSDSLTHIKTVESQQAVQALSAYNLPSKFAVQHVTPRQDQAQRGTCWDFATISYLEWSYRANGVANGWLKDEEYVAFSEQGGEDYDLYYLRDGLKNSVLPTAVCPYFKKGNEDVCPGLDAALEHNPVQFQNISTFYDGPTIKLELFSKNKALSIGTPVLSVSHYYPCIGPFLSDPHCQKDKDTCTLCPSDLSQTTCCIPSHGGHNPNMEGEFFAHSRMSLSGGHAMHLVGYNDAFENHEGEVGGFILKNSWADSQTRGSHTLKWWLQEISDWEERTICPNSYNPTNWYACGGTDDNADLVSPTNATEKVVFNKGVEDCLSNTTRMFAKTMVQTLELKCSDATKCTVSDDVTYYVRNTTDWGDRMTLMCVWEHNVKVGSARDFCLIPMLEQNLAATFKYVVRRSFWNVTLGVGQKSRSPTTWTGAGFTFSRTKQVRRRFADMDGSWWHVVARRYLAQFGNFFVNGYDIEWNPSSYLANADKFPTLNYTLLQQSTFRQNKDDFVGPHPYAKAIASAP
ncbi:hypothetical protein DYB32_005537 [Aphanomyces invadans]|uniref:Peptidase C1A papain C-terminal domain-containing protein n=1 Tax=Aphanomyces invadans TaxID=157072 RepID=A0A3R6ZPF0_9STRA|nr:hypothetical protein DYB32_005537 [Aphanomyces invadans]